jgi:4-diphosphocytidyl-2-C-methyl-D-erythritol kinase
MTGLGDVVGPLEAPGVNVVLVNPGKPLSTPAVYRRFDELELGSDFAERPAPVWRVVDDLLEGIWTFGNDLEASAVSLMPDLGELLAILRADPRVLCASLSGSGATCFAITQSGDSAAAMAEDLSARNRDWWVRATTLGRP